MINMVVLHLTDLHFGDGPPANFLESQFGYNEIAELLAGHIEAMAPDKLLIAVGGDVTNKGQDKKYMHAKKFLQSLKIALKDIPTEIIFCPGNHDIESGLENKFTHFNIFMSEVSETSEQFFLEGRSVLVHDVGESIWVCVNSAYQGNPKISSVNLQELEEKLLSHVKPVYVLTHHHLIPYYQDDSSAINNAFSFIQLCLGYKVNAVLHGHIHNNLRLVIGNGKHSLQLIGTGTALSTMSTNYNNQVTILKMDSGNILELLNCKLDYNPVNNHKPTLNISNILL